MCARTGLITTRHLAHGHGAPHHRRELRCPVREADVRLNHMAYEIKRYWLAKTLGMPNEKVRVHQTYVGGAFGGKAVIFDFEVIAAFLSRKLGRPVKLELTREKVFSTCRNSVRFDTTLKTGVKKDGTIVAQHAKVIVDAGAYKGSAAVAMYLSHVFND